jgi:glutathione S-transferase
MRKLWFGHGSPFARKVRIVLFEKGLDYEADVSERARTIEEIGAVTPTLAIPVFEDNGLRLFESNLIIDYLLKTYPGTAPDAPQDPPLAPALTRPERHWEDARTLAVLETFADAMVNVRMMAPTGVSPENNSYLARQQSRAQRCLDWLETVATPEGFAPGWFSVMDIALVCPVNYCERRNVMPWRGRPKLEAIVARYQQRPSLLATPLKDRSAP